MKSIQSNSLYASEHRRRFFRTLSFIESLPIANHRILDLGPSNPLSQMLKESGYSIENTHEGQDLDLDYHQVEDPRFEVITGFEILEHMVSPFPLLLAAKAEKLVLSVPLKLWFAEAYWNPNDSFDCHYHEFEPKQLKLLLNKAGWIIKKEQKFTHPSFKLGIRPILRFFTPRHYFVYCERNRG